MSDPEIGIRFPLSYIYYILKTDSRTIGFMRQMSQIQLTG